MTARRRAAVAALLIAAWITGFALLDRDLRIDPTRDDLLHEWKCPRCDFGCGSRGGDGGQWVRRIAESHQC